MPERSYRVVFAKTQGGLIVAAGDWTILKNTVREFAGLDSNYDHSFGNPGRLLIRESGWVALAYSDVSD